MTQLDDAVANLERLIALIKDTSLRLEDGDVDRLAEETDDALGAQAEESAAAAKDPL